MAAERSIKMHSSLYKNLGSIELMSDVGSDAQSLTRDAGELALAEGDASFLSKQFNTQSAIFDTSPPGQSAADTLVVNASQAEVARANAAESARFNENQRTPARSLYMRGSGKKKVGKKGKKPAKKTGRKPAAKKGTKTSSKKRAPAKKKAGSKKKSPSTKKKPGKPKPKSRK